MKKWFLPYLLILILIPVIASAQRYAVGDTVSNFTLPDSGGNPVSLYDYSNEIVLIYFWAST